ncbi:glutamate 5-kinase [Candidatus Poribacteria bacterium]|nr:MAG: glutamate 5-kinase [Candidatus Poribacteria bacterium]
MNSSSPIAQKQCNPTEQRTCLRDVQRIVVKVGSSTISEGAHLNEAALDGLVHDLALVKQDGVEVILVTSGAIAAGWPQLGLKQRPNTLPHLQAAAAVGQIRLMAAYKDRFSNYGQRAASMLLTRDDFSNRERYTRMNDTMRALLHFGVIPIINENDTVAVDEIRVGDNDTLSAYVTNLAQAQLLIILSDQAGFYTADPRHNPNSTLIHTVTTISDEIWQAAGTAGTTSGTGGMVTKLRAAEIVTNSGEMMVMAQGQEPLIVTRILKGELLGTLFLPQSRISGRKRWIAYSRPPKGRLIVDSGARDALVQGGKSLLPAGIRRVEGNFDYSDTVSCLTENGVEFARGLVNYNAVDTAKLAGKHTKDIENILGYRDYDEIIHRDNLVLLD